MNKGTMIHPRMFQHHRILWDRQVRLESYIETFDAANQPIRAYAPAEGIPEYIDARRGVFSAQLAASMETRGQEITISVDSEYIALPGYYPQIQKAWRASFVDGENWDILGVVFDSTRTQTYLVVERVTE